jgi:branched-chain amino acid transport system permease protein
MEQLIDFLSSYRLLAYAIGVACLLALSMYVTMRAGVFSFGINGFMAIGAYSSAVLSTSQDLPLIVALIVGGCSAAVIAAVVGFPLLRLRGMYFGIATVAFGEVVRTTVSNWEVTGGALGLFGIPPLTNIWYIFGCLAFFLYAVRTLERSKYGKAIKAMQQDEQVAISYGVDVSVLRTLVFVFSAFIAGVAGALMAHYSNAIMPGDFGFYQLVQITTYTVVGGFSSMLGPILGAVAVTWLGHTMGFAAEAQALLIAVIILLAILFLPKGLLGLLPARWSRQSPTAHASSKASPTAASPVIGPALAQPGEAGSLRVTGLVRQFGGLTAVNNVSFDCMPGEVLGIIGPNGAGKTTVINLLSGLDQPTSGRVQVGSHDITRLRGHLVVSTGLARTFQNIRLFKEFTVAQNVLMGQYATEAGDLQRAFLSRPDWESRQRQTVLACLDTVGLADKADLLASQLSYGQQRRVEIARALSARPHMLLLDEPTAGMNAEETAELAQLILKLRNMGIGVVLIAHDLDLVGEVCDWVIVLNFGTLLASGTASEMRADPRVIEAYIGADTKEDEQHAAH